MTHIHPLSREAYLSLPKGYLSELKTDLLAEIAFYGARTCERIIQDYNFRRKHHGLKFVKENTLRPRLIELKEKGIIIEAGVTVTTSNRQAAILDISPNWLQNTLTQQTTLTTTLT